MRQSSYGRLNENDVSAAITAPLKNPKEPERDSFERFAYDAIFNKSRRHLAKKPTYIIALTRPTQLLRGVFFFL